MRLQAVWIILLVVPVMGLLLPSSSNARVSSNNVVSQRNSNNIKSITSAQTSSTKLSMIEITNDFAIDASSLINAGFNIATFGPQPFWLLMCLLPNFSLTRKFMLPWTTVTFFALVHFAIVVASISEPEGTAPITEVPLSSTSLDFILFNFIYFTYSLRKSLIHLEILSEA